MVLKPEVINAFKVFELDPASTTKEQAATAYKKLALKHHPDRNYGDSSANERFQQIGAAWSICQRHFEYPASSQVPEPGARDGFENFASGRTYSAEDEVPLDDFEAFEFFRFMFEEVFMGRYTHSKGQRYRSQRAGAAGGGVFTFSGGFAEAQRRQAENAARQAKEHEEYKKRVRDFEREQAEEQAGIDRLAHEEARDQARLASAQNSAFQLAKEGNSADLRALIEKFDLDVTQPRKLNQKRAEINFETLLHVAAGSCDVALLDWLLGRGANPSALDPSHLTPFHVAILRGNTPVARHLISLYRNTKSTDPRYQSFCDGCHPSKAAKDKDGSTPLELAIKSGSIDMVELLLKDATVHNAQRCWSQLEQQGTNKMIADILLTKNGFKPPEQNGVEAQHPSMTKKALRKLKQAEEEKRANEERARRLAEEEENRVKKQVRREKAAKEEVERQAVREAEERKRIEEAGEEERKRRAKLQKQARRDAEERALREAEEQARREAEAQKQREEERRQEAAREAKRKSREKEAAAMQKVKAEALARQREIEAASARQAKAKAEAKAARFAQREAELQCEHELRVKAEKQRAKQEQEEQLQRETARLMVKAKATLQQEQENARRIQEEAQEAARASQDAKMRRRAEQSARDKARNQRMREEKARLQALESVVAPPTPLTPSPKNSMLPMQDQTTPTITKHKRSKRSSSSIVSPSEPPPVPLHTRPKIESAYSHPPTLLSPPMTPEDLQTIPIPEDLFSYEAPTTVIKDSVSSSPTSNAPALRARGQIVGQRGRGRGQGVVRDASVHASPSETDESGHGTPCRFFNKRGGCARGLQCAFSHVATPRIRRTALEEELAKKNLELERMRAELAAANARVS